MTCLLNNLLMHAQSQQFEKPNNFKVFGSKKTKDNNRKVTIGYGHLCLRSTHFSDGELLFPESIIRPVVSALALTWFIRYICY
jgi:hypothetical protein